jgi:hypothetical protein
MIVYVGQTRAASWIRRCNDNSFREMTVRGELPPRRNPWAYDNGAYKDWKSDRPFDINRYTRDLRRIRNEGFPNPDFVVLPDIPGEGRKSFEQSVSWLEWTRSTLHPTKVPLYLAVQDGMEEMTQEIADLDVDGLFVGGTLDWKLVWGAAWVAIAHRQDRKCHIGRVGTAQRVKWALEIGVDSIDSCQPLRNEVEFERFCRALQPTTQETLFDHSGC